MQKMPPQNKPTETNVLGGLVLDGEEDQKFIDQVIDSLSADDFYSPDNKYIYEAICSTYQKYERVDRNGGLDGFLERQ
ncbi:MAG: hypothetical protein JW860_02615 [Sedimentisphaerales bacterium]|nr:hypothetical protein [Sedimentisphaerales bacterium]